MTKSLESTLLKFSGCSQTSHDKFSSCLSIFNMRHELRSLEPAYTPLKPGICGKRVCLFERASGYHFNCILPGTNSIPVSYADVKGVLVMTFFSQPPLINSVTPVRPSSLHILLHISPSDSSTGRSEGSCIFHGLTLQYICSS